MAPSRLSHPNLSSVIVSLLAMALPRQPLSNAAFSHKKRRAHIERALNV